MKKAFKILRYLVFAILGLVLLVIIVFYAYYGVKSSRNMSKLGVEAPLLKQDGKTFRDFNKNGKLDIYEDVRRPVEERVEDLLSQMTLKEKAGTMFITMILMNEDGSLMERPSPSNPFSFFLPTNSDMVANRLMNHFNVLQLAKPKQAAEWYDRLQKMAERTRLGIPITIASDPRHAFSENLGANLLAGDFSQWCEPIGLAATRDTALVQQFGDIARQEYLAVGIRLALHPMADLATEPRWARINGTFGEDAELSAAMVRAYIRGFQGKGIGHTSVACMTKHFSGGGPQKDGLDAHFPYGREQVYPGNNFDYHLIPFEEGAFKAGTAEIMPYYGVPMGQTSEDVGFAFNKDIITGLLRNRYGFGGVICSDWGLLTDTKIGNQVMLARAWGVENLSPLERAKKILDAGVDQFGGEASPELVVELVEKGMVPESRIDQSVRRLLLAKFKLGLFDQRYVNPELAEKIVGKEAFRKAGALSQRKSIVLLKNGDDGQDNRLLPLKVGTKIYVENIRPEVANKYGNLVDSVEDADVAILRLKAPFQPRNENFLERFFHQGDLDFKGPEKQRILDILERIPTIVDIYLDRPAVIPEIAEKSAGLLANFGAADEAVLDVIFGKFKPTGKLPFELPSSMEAVRKQKEDLPYDSENPLFHFGFGLSYGDSTLVLQ